MQLNWGIIFLTQVLIWLIVLFDWKRLKQSTKVDKITFTSILLLATLMSWLDLDDLPGPITLLQYIFGPLGKLMD